MTLLNKTYQTSSGDSTKIANKVNASISFYEKCNFLLIKAYQIILDQKKYAIDWQEDTFSANFAIELETLCNEQELPYSIHFQDPQLTPAILTGATKPLNAGKIDILFKTFGKPNGLRYGIEAKILASENILKRNARKLCREYITEGMDRFIDGNYKVKGSMVGYIIKGKADSIVRQINEILETKNRTIEALNGKHKIDGYGFCYHSQHGTFVLKHILFHFS